MTALTLRLADDNYRRLKELAQKRGTSVNRLIDEMATVLLAEQDGETSFMIRAERGKGQEARGLSLLEKAAANEHR